MAFSVLIVLFKKEKKKITLEKYLLKIMYIKNLKMQKLNQVISCRSEEN